MSQKGSNIARRQSPGAEYTCYVAVGLAWLWLSAFQASFAQGIFGAGPPLPSLPIRAGMSQLILGFGPKRGTL
jgi:hypothetical protein